MVLLQESWVFILIDKVFYLVNTLNLLNFLWPSLQSFLVKSLTTYVLTHSVDITC